MTRTLLALALLSFAILPLAAAQGPDPYDDSAPADDASYTSGDATPEAAPNATGDPSVTDADLDASPPADDATYLDGAATPADAVSTESFGADATSAPAAGESAPPSTSQPSAKAPGFEAVLVAGALLVALLIAQRR